KLPGDSDRQTNAFLMQRPSASNPITLPASIPPGQVAWAQPVIVLSDNTMQWGDAVVMPVASSPYDRKPANLVANFQTPRERTLKLKYTLSVNNKQTKADIDMLEVLTPNSDGGAVSTAYGTLNLTAVGAPIG